MKELPIGSLLGTMNCSISEESVREYLGFVEEITKLKENVTEYVPIDMIFAATLPGLPDLGKTLDMDYSNTLATSISRESDAPWLVDIDTMVTRSVYSYEVKPKWKFVTIQTICYQGKSVVLNEKITFAERV